MEAPIVKQPIPLIIISELAAYGPVHLSQYVQNPDGTETGLTFQAGLKDGSGLPKGVICTETGLLTAIPAKHTSGEYAVVLSVSNAAGSIDADFTLLIKPGFSPESPEDWNDLKAEIWYALEADLPMPALTDLYDKDVTPLEIYYLLERWGVLIVWDAFNLDPPGEKQLLTLEGVSPHYHVYDRGSSIIAVPKELFSHERTTVDGLLTATAVAREVYKRGWAVELGGFDKYVRAAWVEIERLGLQHGKKLDVINFKPNFQDVKVSEKVNKVNKGLST